jgi:hypothetical protein
MNRIVINVIFILSMAFTHSAIAEDNPQESWQLSLLFNPSNLQYEMERRGRIFIYDGLLDSDIEKALDEQYDRIEGMMFINTVVTNDNGVPLKDPETGELVVENDGCD